METANNITINTDDKNLAEVIKKIIAEAGLTIADLFSDDDVISHVQEGGIPVDAIYDEEELLENDMIQKMLEDEREALDSDGWAKVDEKDEEIEELEEKIQELEDQIAELEERNDELDAEKTELDHDNEIVKKKWRKLEKENAELERQLAEFREWNAKMKDNENEEWCRRCGSWQNCERDGSNIIKDAKWGCVCHDCLHHLDNPDHERCKECDCCKGCDCCECDEEENDDIVEGQIVDDEE